MTPQTQTASTEIEKLHDELHKMIQCSKFGWFNWTELSKAHQMLYKIKHLSVLPTEEQTTPYDYAPWKPPFRYDPHGTMILDSADRMIIDVRGWGFLTGKGHAALGLHEETACVIQDRLGEHITKLLNATSVVSSNDSGALPVSQEKWNDDSWEEIGLFSRPEQWSLIVSSHNATLSPTPEIPVSKEREEFGENKSHEN